VRPNGCHGSPEAMYFDMQNASQFNNGRHFLFGVEYPPSVVEAARWAC
jgi:hypothetical protein